MIFQRTIQKNIENNLFEGKIIVLYGARQVGKTTLLQEIRTKYQNRETLLFNGDEPDTRAFFTGATSTALKNAFGTAEIVFIDEAQRVENIGITLKLAIDSMPEKQFIVTGSSSFDLANTINEPLTGRKYEFHLSPLSLEELAPHFTQEEQKRLLNDRIIFGSYPDIVKNPHKKRQLLEELARGNLYKDILAYQELKRSDLLEKLLKALALQIGNEVSYNELASLLGTTKETVERYIRLLEQSFLIFRLSPFSRNIRTELRKMRKIYFFDTGLRNAILGAFAPHDMRNDMGALWENFILAERMKYMHHHQYFTHSYFWRTHQQQEIDYLEERDAELKAFEFKWNTKKYPKKAPKAFRDGYPDASFSVITPENYQRFVGIKV